MKTDENRQMDETKIMDNANAENTEMLNDSTLIIDGPADNAQPQEEDTALFNEAAPVSKKAASRSPWASRLGFGAVGAAAGFAAGYAVSANAGTTASSSTVSGLAPAATPEQDMTDEQKADTVIPDRERTTLEDDVFEKPASVTAENTHTETENATAHAATAHAATTHAATATQAATEHVHHAAAATQATEAQPQIEVTVDDQATVTGTVPEQSDIILENGNGIHYAHVTDDLSFGEAFAQARVQVGTPGVFVWHGNTYGTYYAEEWNAMSAQERNDFIHAVDYPEDLNREAPVAETVTEPDVDVQIVDISQTMDASGSVTTTGHITVNGVDVYMTDVDGDGTMDTAVVDIDGNGEFNPMNDAMLPIGQAGVTVDDFVDAIRDNNPAELQIDINDDMAQMDFNPDTTPDY